mgnify:CR=1 FL=1
MDLFDRSDIGQRFSGPLEIDRPIIGDLTQNVVVGIDPTESGTMTLDGSEPRQRMQDDEVARLEGLIKEQVESGVFDKSDKQGFADVDEVSIELVGGEPRRVIISTQATTVTDAQTRKAVDVVQEVIGGTPTNFKVVAEA